MRDKFSIEAAGQATSFACPAFATTSWPFEADKILPLQNIPNTILASSEFIMLVHKDDIRVDDYAIYASLLGRASVVFANEVYVVFHVRSSAFDRDNIKSLYVRAAELHQSHGPSMVAGAKSEARFCTYIGDNTLLTETYFARKIYVDSRDISVTPHIACEGKWEPHISKFISDNLKDGDVFIDVGANCGFFTLLAAHHVGLRGFVLAIEPQKKLSSLIKKSLDINGFRSFSDVENMAVTAEVGEVYLRHSGDYLGSASLASLGANETASELVGGQPLDDIVATVEHRRMRILKPRMIKVDVEGFEKSVWQGGRKTFSVTDIVVLEFSSSRYRDLGIDPDVFLDEMQGDGFNINELSHDGSLLPLTPELRSNILNRADFTDLVLLRR